MTVCVLRDRYGMRGGKHHRPAVAPPPTNRTAKQSCVVVLLPTPTTLTKRAPHAPVFARAPPKQRLGVVLRVEVGGPRPPL